MAAFLLEHSVICDKVELLTLMAQNVLLKV